MAQWLESVPQREEEEFFYSLLFSSSRRLNHLAFLSPQQLPCMVGGTEEVLGEM